MSNKALDSIHRYRTGQKLQESTLANHLAMNVRSAPVGVDGASLSDRVLGAVLVPTVEAIGAVFAALDQLSGDEKTRQHGLPSWPMRGRFGN